MKIGEKTLSFSSVPQLNLRRMSTLLFISKVAGRKYQGTIQRVASSSGDLASITGFILGGFLYGILTGTSFLIAGLVIYTVFYSTFSSGILRIYKK